MVTWKQNADICICDIDTDVDTDTDDLLKNHSAVHHLLLWKKVRQLDASDIISCQPWMKINLDKLQGNQDFCEDFFSSKMRRVKVDRKQLLAAFMLARAFIGTTKLFYLNKSLAHSTNQRVFGFWRVE